MDWITIIYLSLMFISLYMFSFFVILTIKNKNRLFESPLPKKDYLISILVPAYNEEDSIQDTIDHVMSLNYPKDKLEVIAINDGSKDKTYKILCELKNKYPILKILNKENSGKADSLNQGINMSKGELIAVVDSDSFPSKDSLMKLTGFFNEDKIAAVTSFVTVRNKDENFFAKIQSIEYMILGWARKLLDFVDSVYVTNGPLSLYRKKYLIEVKGFDLKTVTEDIDVTWNLLAHGYKTAMCLDARVSTVVPSKFKSWYRQRTRWGLGGLQAIFKYKSMFFKKGMFGAFILPFVSFSIIISLIAFVFSLYLIFKGVILRSEVFAKSLISNVSVFHFQDVNLSPSVLFFYLIILFSSSITYYSYILYKTRYDEKLSTKRFFNLIFYILFYLSIYSVVWFSSIYRFIIKDYKW